MKLNFEKIRLVNPNFLNRFPFGLSPPVAFCSFVSQSRRDHDDIH